MWNVSRLVTGVLLSIIVNSPAGAQSVPPTANAKDKMIPKGVTGAVVDWEEEQWWLALADCAAAFRVPPQDQEKFRTFSLAAIQRVATDRGINLRQATEIVLPYATSGQGLERAKTTSGIFGGPEDLRSRCDKVLIQYRAAFP
jgi:hypothetical protein